MTGRPPKPTALKLLHGDDKKNPARINRTEPHPVGPVEPPDYLSAPARQVWEALAPGMILAGVLTSWDTALFGEFCEALIIARMARMQAAREASGKFASAPGAASPTTAWIKAMSIVITLGSKFGLTPGDRTRLTTQETNRDGSADLLSSGW